MEKFVSRIKAMNERYELPVHSTPYLYDENQLERFKSVLLEEIEKIDEIPATGTINDDGTIVTALDVLVAYADLISDIMVYCTSETQKFGIPIEPVLDIVMDSNESKLGLDGKPIKDKRGKFLKGPNYWPSEDKIAELFTNMVQ